MTHTARRARQVATASQFIGAAYPILRQMLVEVPATLRLTIQARGWDDKQAAAILHVGQPRIAALRANRWELFSLELLLTLAVRAELAPRVVFTHPRTVLSLRRDATA